MQAYTMRILHRVQLRVSDEVHLDEETHFSSLRTTTGWQLAEVRASGASKSIPWNLNGHWEVGGYLNMKKKLLLKVVSILGEDKPRRRTRTHPTQNQRSTTLSTVPAGCWWDMINHEFIKNIHRELKAYNVRETWKGWKSGERWDVEDLVWWYVAKEQVT